MGIIILSLPLTRESSGQEKSTRLKVVLTKMSRVSPPKVVGVGGELPKRDLSSPSSKAHRNPTREMHPSPFYGFSNNLLLFLPVLISISIMGLP